MNYKNLECPVRAALLLVAKEATVSLMARANHYFLKQKVTKTWGLRSSQTPKRFLVEVVFLLEVERGVSCKNETN